MHCLCNGVVVSYAFNFVSGDPRTFEMHCSPGHKRGVKKSYGIRRAPLDCYTTIGEHFGKDSVAADVEIIYDAKDCDRDLREQEVASNTQIMESTNHGGLLQTTNIQNF
jgi:hypothetical protein